MSFLENMGKILSLFALLYYRPEVFIVIFKTFYRNGLLAFLIVWFWTSLLTIITYFVPDFFKKIFEKIFKFSRGSSTRNSWLYSLNKKIESLNSKILKKIIKFFPKLIFLTFLFPILPGLDTMSVIFARILKIRFALAIFILLNTIKFLIISLL
jgi:hypothetical protein